MRFRFSATQNIWFLNQCVKKGIFPKYIELKTNNKSPQARKGVFKGKLQWLKEDRKTQYRNRDSYNVYLKVIHTELSFRLHPVEFDTLDFNVRRQVNCLIDRKYQNQINLVSRKNKPLINPEKNFSNHTFF